jgi:cell division protein FtsZ
MLKVDPPKNDYPKVKLIGVGNMGCDIVNYLFTKGIYGTEFLVCNSDEKTLNASPVIDKIHIENTFSIDSKLNEKGRKSYKNEILSFFTRLTNALIVVAELSEYENSGISSDVRQIKEEFIVNDINKEKILCIGLILSEKNEANKHSISKLQNSFDSLLLFSECDFSQSEHPYYNSKENILHYFLHKASSCIIETFTIQGFVCTDFRDLYYMMKNKGRIGFMGIGIAETDKSILKAVEMAFQSLLMKGTDLKTIKKILLSFNTKDYGITIPEVCECTDFIQKRTSKNAVIMWGAGLDNNLEDKNEITIIIC